MVEVKMSRYTSRDRKILEELQHLVQETFTLWDQIWVGFSWRHYYLNHTQRVRALSREMGKRERADVRALEYAALLHDITKRYDGPIITDNEGRRVLDDNGFWHNELLHPTRMNLVTEYYQKHDQFHELHNISGALIANKILESYGFNGDFCNRVSAIIRCHLNPSMDESTSTIENQILYEADTIDSNIGLIAFYRNIQIRTHNQIVATGKSDLHHYVKQIAPWIERKTIFLEKISSKTGNEVALKRLDRMKRTYQQIIADYRQNYDQSIKYGILGIMQYFMDHNHDPNLRDEIHELYTHWIPTRKGLVASKDDVNGSQVLTAAINFCQLLSHEIQGLA